MDAAAMASAEAQANTIKQRVVDGHVAAGGDAAKISPVIGQIIQFLLQLITSGGICPSPAPTPTKAPAQSAADLKAMEQHPIIARAQLAMANRRQGFPQPRQLAQGMFTALTATPVEELTAMATTAQAMQSVVDQIPE